MTNSIRGWAGATGFMKLSTTASEPVCFTIVRPDRSGYDPGGNLANYVRLVTQDARGPQRPPRISKQVRSSMSRFLPSTVGTKRALTNKVLREIGGCRGAGEVACAARPGQGKSA
jgi:hypothetical protein